jgi:hypothetical protein
VDFILKEIKYDDEMIEIFSSELEHASELDIDQYDDEMIKIFSSELEHASELDIDAYDQKDVISDTTEILTAMDWNDLENEVLNFHNNDSKSTSESQISLDWRECDKEFENNHFKMMIIVDW